MRLQVTEYWLYPLIYVCWVFFVFPIRVYVLILLFPGSAAVSPDAGSSSQSAQAGKSTRGRGEDEELVERRGKDYIGEE